MRQFFGAGAVNIFQELESGIYITLQVGLYPCIILSQGIDSLIQLAHGINAFIILVDTIGCFRKPEVFQIKQFLILTKAYSYVFSFCAIATGGRSFLVTPSVT